MATTKETIGRWFNAGVELGWDFMIVTCDTFDHEDIGEYCKADDFWEKHKEIEDRPMTRIMEVYNLHGDIDRQLAEPRAYHPPIRVRKLKHEKVTRLGNLRCDADQQRWPCQFELARLLKLAVDVVKRVENDDRDTLGAEIDVAVAEVAKHDWE